MKLLIVLFFTILSLHATADEIYLAKFKTMNSQINGTIAGSTTFYLRKDLVTIYNRFFAGAPSAWHMQNIYTGIRCPDMSDDLNSDGLIDIKEGNNVWGNILIPLDADINSQYGGHRIFPLGDIYGSYFYETDGSYSRLVTDLRAADLNPHDNIIKLPPSQNLNLEGKVVVIQGVSKNFADIPETVATMGEDPSYVTIPIACGTFKRLQSR